MLSDLTHLFDWAVQASEKEGRPLLPQLQGQVNQAALCPEVGPVVEPQHGERALAAILGFAVT